MSGKTRKATIRAERGSHGIHAPVEPEGAAVQFSVNRKTYQRVPRRVSCPLAYAVKKANGQNMPGRNGECQHGLGNGL